MNITIGYNLETLLKALALAGTMPEQELAERALAIGLRSLVEEAEGTRPWQGTQGAKYWERAMEQIEQSATIRTPAVKTFDPIEGIHHVANARTENRSS